ncbi:MAG: M1 family aminopeptidase, partial [Bacteroidia bacterium]|nr:M1 family aminopeptidase [Bacteroidia bacterium]
VNVHELTHQWFGDYITARSAKHIWLQESFATYYPKLFFKKIYGEDYYQWQRRGEHQSALAASEKDKLPIVHSQAGTARFYPKGSAVIDMMNYVFGENAYKKVIHHYLKKFPYKNVETNDLYLAFQDTLGLTVDWFFDQWLYRGGEPHYEVKWQDVKNATTNQRETQVIVNQIQATDGLIPLFKMPVVIEVVYMDGTSESVRVWVEKQSHQFSIPNTGNKPIAFVLFDPGSNILKKLTFKKSFDELKLQALKAHHMIDRYDALVELRDIELSKKRDLLTQIFEKETFHALKAEVINQLSQDTESSSLQIFQKASKDPAVEVRSALLTYIKIIPPAILPAVEAMLTDSSYNIVYLALEKLAEQNPKSLAKYLEACKNDIGIGAKVKVKWLELNYLFKKQEFEKNEKNREAEREMIKSLNTLISYASNSFEFQTRNNAFQSLKRLNVLTEAAISHILDAMLSPNPRLAGPAANCLEYFYTQTDYKRKIKTVYESKTWESWQKEILEKVIK